MITPANDEWPAARLAALRGDQTWTVAPLALWVRGAGSLAALTRRAVSIVGSRAATGSGEHTATEFGHGLAGAGVTVVSGAAYGIDGAAHRGALVAAGPTVAVLGCGIDIDYPSGHTDLLSRIAERNGLVVSELPPGTRPARNNLLARNRLVAALGASLVVVEAAVRSGSRNTAATAQAIGRPVLAVPGPVTSVMSAMPNEWLRARTATAVTSVRDILDSTPFPD